MKETRLLDAVLAPGGISVLFEPIVQCIENHRRTVAWECLSRGPKGTNLERADILFEYVRGMGEEVLVDRACVAHALREASRFPGHMDFTVNLHASTLGRDTQFPRFLQDTTEALGFPPERVIIEIIEQVPSWDDRNFVQALDGLRSLGVRIALDDVGLGLSNFQMILECRPDYLKIDRYFIRNCQWDPGKLAVLKSITMLAEELQCMVIGEGVETIREFETLSKMGITLMQGYHFSHPLTLSEAAGHVRFVRAKESFRQVALVN